MSKTTRAITHDEAAAAARRLIHGAFRRDGERLSDDDRPRFHIPARPDACDDLVLTAYIEQQRAKA
jgi:hypothetical protein